MIWDSTRCRAAGNSRGHRYDPDPRQCSTLVQRGGYGLGLGSCLPLGASIRDPLPPGARTTPTPATTPARKRPPPPRRNTPTHRPAVTGSGSSYVIGKAVVTEDEDRDF